MRISLWIIHVVVPLVDTILPIDHYNLPKESVRAYEKDKRFYLPMYSMWILDFGTFYYVLYLISKGAFA